MFYTNCFSDLLLMGRYPYLGTLCVPVISEQMFLYPFSYCTCTMVYSCMLYLYHVQWVAYFKNIEYDVHSQLYLFYHICTCIFKRAFIRLLHEHVHVQTLYQPSFITLSLYVIVVVNRSL